MIVRFTLPALADLEAIIDYVAQRSPASADRIAVRVREIAALVGNQPDAGRPTSDPTVRQFSLMPYPYVLFYERSGEAVRILAIRHAARDPATMPGWGSAKPGK